MAVVSVDIDVVTENIASIRNEITQQGQNLGNIANDIRFMDAAWEDQAQKVYADNFQATKSKIENFNQALGDYLSTFQVFVNRVDELDKAMGRALDKVTW